MEKKEMKVLVEDNQTVMGVLEQGRRVEGSLCLDSATGTVSFRAYQRASRMPGYVAPCKVLYETANGSLRQTARRNKMAVSIKRSLGNVRCAKEMLAQAKEMAKHLEGVENSRGLST